MKASALSSILFERVACISREHTIGREGKRDLREESRSPSASPISSTLMEPWRARQIPSIFSFLAFSMISLFSFSYIFLSQTPLGTALASTVGTTSIPSFSSLSTIPVMASSALCERISSPLRILMSFSPVIMGLKVSLSWWRPPVRTLISYLPLLSLLYLNWCAG